MIIIKKHKIIMMIIIIKKTRPHKELYRIIERILLKITVSYAYYVHYTITSHC